MEIVSRGIHKGEDKEKSREKNKENMDHFLEEKSVEEILKEVQVVIHNKHNGNFHGQTSNLEQLGPKGIRAQGATYSQQHEASYSSISTNPSFKGNPTILDAWLEKNEFIENPEEIMVAEEQGSS